MAATSLFPAALEVEPFCQCALPQHLICCSCSKKSKTTLPLRTAPPRHAFSGGLISKYIQNGISNVQDKEEGRGNSGLRIRFATRHLPLDTSHIFRYIHLFIFELEHGSMEKQKNGISLLGRYFRLHRKHMLCAGSYSVLNKLFDLAPPYLIGAAVDIAVRQEQSIIAQLGIRNAASQFVILGLITFMIWMLESVFEYLYKISWLNLAQHIQHDIRNETYAHIQTLEMAFFENEQTGGIMSVLNNDINQLERFLNEGLNTIIQITVTVLVISTSFFILSPQIAWMAIIPIPFLIAFSIKYQRFLEPKYQAVRTAVGHINGILSNNLTGMATIKSYIAEAYECQRVERFSQHYLDANKNAITYSAAFVPLIRMIIVVGFTLILVFGGIRTMNGNFEIAAYSAMIFLTQRLLWPLTGLGYTLDLYQRAMASVQRIETLLTRKSSIHNGALPLPIDAVKGEIHFNDIHFAYQGRTPTFSGFTTAVQAGHSIAFVGATGSGKSTIIKLLLRFYDPCSGSITLDGHDIRDYDLHDLRKAMAMVKQETFIIDGSIRENIAYGHPETSLDQVVNAAQMAEIHEFVMGLKDQYETQVGERGQKLSGGQRQRIAIARAILKDPPILILDEATSSVDNETEAAIQRSLDKIVKNRTTIIIAHRLSTIRNVDQIYVIGNQGIQEQGTHDELLTHQGLYASLWDVQRGIRHSDILC